jgi:hypothetical protein
VWQAYSLPPGFETDGPARHAALARAIAQRRGAPAEPWGVALIPVGPARPGSAASARRGRRERAPPPTLSAPHGPAPPSLLRPGPEPTASGPSRSRRTPRPVTPCCSGMQAPLAVGSRGAGPARPRACIRVVGPPARGSRGAMARPSGRLVARPVDPPWAPGRSSPGWPVRVHATVHRGQDNTPTLLVAAVHRRQDNTPTLLVAAVHRGQDNTPTLLVAAVHRGQDNTPMLLVAAVHRGRNSARRHRMHRVTARPHTGHVPSSPPDALRHRRAGPSPIPGHGIHARARDRSGAGLLLPSAPGAPPRPAAGCSRAGWAG